MQKPTSVHSLETSASWESSSVAVMFQAGSQ